MPGSCTDGPIRCRSSNADRQLWRRRATPVLQDSAPFVLHEVAGVQRPPIAGDDVNRRANVVRLTVELDDRLSPYLQRRAAVLACNAHGPSVPNHNARTILKHAPNRQ